MQFPKEWSTVKFEDAFEYLPKSGIKAGEGKEEGKYKFFTSSSEQTKYVDEAVYAGEHLIFGTGGAPSIHHCKGQFSTSTDCWVVQCSKKDLEPKFVYYFFKENPSILARGFRGAGLKHLSRHHLNAVIIPKPPLDVQKKIVALLEKAEKLIQFREEADNLTEEYLKAIFYEMFGDPVINVKKWAVSRISEISEKTQIGPFGTQLHVEDYISNGIPLINPMHIVDKKIQADQNFTISKEKYQELANYHLKTSDIIMGRRGEMARCALVTTKEDGWLCGTGSLFIRPKNTINPIFLLHYLTHESTKKVLENNSRGVTMNNLNLAIVNDLKLIIPPISLQHKFAKMVQQIEKMKDEQSESKHNVNTLFNSLMASAFRGEILC
jgi:type I restriction enzyme S subunit